MPKPSQAGGEGPFNPVQNLEGSLGALLRSSSEESGPVGEDWPVHPEISKQTEASKLTLRRCSLYFGSLKQGERESSLAKAGKSSNPLLIAGLRKGPRR